MDKWQSKGVTIHEVNSAISGVPVQITLTYKPKAFIIASDNCKRKLITDVLDKAGIPSSAWSWGKCLTSVDLDCYSVIMVPHRKHCEWPTFSSDLPKIKTFLNNGGNLYAQCAATEAIEDSAKFLTTKGFDRNNQKENWIYPDAGAQVFFGQFVGKLEKEGGYVKSFQPTSGGAWRSNMIDVAHNKCGAEPHKAVLGHKDNDATKGWVMYAGGHEFKCKTQSSRLLLNAFIMGARREDCPCYDFSPIYIGPGRDITSKTLTADWN
ncbi:MAG: hypothetical protein GXO82_01560, partial [Chlorobi bacterium]|nr:hypothetical protein [Chlorobiota bacterium]